MAVANVTSLQPITASWGNSVVTEFNNVVKRIVCTSGTRPTGSAGLEIYETDTFRSLVHDGTGWVIMSEPTQTYAPVFAQPSTLTGTASLAQYHRSDGWIDVAISWSSTAAGSAANAVLISLPIAGTAQYTPIGTASVLDVSTTTRYVCHPEISNFAATFFGLLGDNTTGNGYWGQGPSIAIAVGDAIRINLRYRMVTRYS